MGTFVTLGGETQESFLNIEPIDLTYTGLKKGCLAGEVAVVTGSADVEAMKAAVADAGYEVTGVA